MKCTDTDSKGKAIFKTNSGVYFGLTEEELTQAIMVFFQTRDHKEAGLPRKYVDSRRNY